MLEAGATSAYDLQPTFGSLLFTGQDTASNERQTLKVVVLYPPRGGANNFYRLSVRKE
jgi:hypothetical protein